MNRTDVMGIKYVNSEILETVECAMQCLEEQGGVYALAADSVLMRAAQRDSQIMSAIAGAAFIFPEGSTPIYASHILGMPIENKTSILDFAAALMARMSEKGMSVFILGTETEQVEDLVSAINSRYPGLVIAGQEDGYYSDDEDIIAMINAAKPDLVLVCKQSPGQELWMHSVAARLKAGLVLAFGEPAKVLTGSKELAPQRWRQSGIEWVYWIKKDPRRIGRTLQSAGLLATTLMRRIVG